MSARHAFAYVSATALIAITAALLHPLLGLGPLHGLEGLQGQSSSAKLGSTGHSTAPVTRSR